MLSNDIPLSREEVNADAVFEVVLMFAEEEGAVVVKSAFDSFAEDVVCVV
jgi:hypothetical protein